MICPATETFLVHSMGYTPDLAQGTAMLGNTPDAFNQIWNLPVDSARATRRDWVAIIAKELNASNKVTVLPAWALKTLGIFMPIMNELHDTSYQFARDFFFDSQKFN